MVEFTDALLRRGRLPARGGGSGVEVPDGRRDHVRGDVIRIVFGRDVVASRRTAFSAAPDEFPAHLTVSSKQDDTEVESNRALAAQRRSADPDPRGEAEALPTRERVSLRSVGVDDRRPFVPRDTVLADRAQLTDVPAEPGSAVRVAAGPPQEVVLDG